MFVYTKDEHTKEKLEALGFELVRQNGSVWVFFNKNDFKFSVAEMEDCSLIYSDELTF